MGKKEEREEIIVEGKETEGRKRNELNKDGSRERRKEERKEIRKEDYEVRKKDNKIRPGICVTDIMTRPP